MPESSTRVRVNWRQAWGEALLIFLGVAAALLGQAWWEYRADRELEQHLLEGIRQDLARDSADIVSAMTAATVRVVGADRLLDQIGDPDAGVLHPTPWSAGRPLREREWLELALAEYASQPVSVPDALYMVAGTSSMQRLDLSEATFSEATTSGRFGVIQDSDLRTRIAEYYFNTGRFGGTTDSRVEAHWQIFKSVLAAAGLPANGGGTPVAILTTLREAPQVVAELKNVRDYAAYQLGAHAVVLESAVSVISTLDAAFAVRR